MILWMNLTLLKFKAQWIIWIGNGSGVGIPTIDDLRKKAEHLLRGAAEARLGEYKDTHWEQGIINGTGGFQAMAFCNEDKTKIIGLDLKFVLAEWDESIEE
jgi:hypothetical protein